MLFIINLISFGCFSTSCLIVTCDASQFQASGITSMIVRSRHVILTLWCAARHTSCSTSGERYVCQTVCVSGLRAAWMADTMCLSMYLCSRHHVSRHVVVAASPQNKQIMYNLRINLCELLLEWQISMSAIFKIFFIKPLVSNLLPLAG